MGIGYHFKPTGKEYNHHPAPLLSSSTTTITITIIITTTTIFRLPQPLTPPTSSSTGLGSLKLNSPLAPLLEPAPPLVPLPPLAPLFLPISLPLSSSTAFHLLSSTSLVLTSFFNASLAETNPSILSRDQSFHCQYTHTRVRRSRIPVAALHLV